MEKLTALITSTVNRLGYELVEFEKIGGVLRIFIEVEAQSANINLQDCEKVSTQIHYVLEAERIDYQRLEVSSPGLDRPLKKLADFVRFSGSEAAIKLKKPLNGRKKYQGVLHLPHGETVRLEIAENKDKDKGKGSAVLDFTLADIDNARLVPQVKFRSMKQ